jgi:PEP-CTERM motif
VLLGSLAFSVSLAAYATIIFDNSSVASGFFSFRGAGSSPLALIDVAHPTAINQIGVLADLDSNGDLRFLIFDNGIQALLFDSGTVAFIADGFHFRLSPTFPSFILQPGVTYAIGAISDVPAVWMSGVTPPPRNPFIEDGITGLFANQNVSNFASPALVGGGVAMVGLQLAAPEPATLTMLGVGLAGVGFSRRRQKGRWGRKKFSG